MTFANDAEALKIGRELVERRLVAGVNLISGARSIYRWRGVVRDERECLLVAQAAEENFDAINSFIAGVHSYETPCVAAVKLSAGASEFMEWIRNNGEWSPT